ncbi:hypothetical protein OCAE111667_23640 [Occultella aeris]|uniref:Uncharacterized protein n=1 Tax=Occultella aeris TaxID=2761496 RepID=A0A7M4DHJ1_9MICO|nr:hypothetical protein [Occultella aeris]VZO36384.1 hypothetical protein HALOF300_01589 [Occultella aeris]
MASDVMAGIQLLATVGLLWVTYRYARTTKSMADTAKEAASESARATAAAERSADAARHAAAVAQSRIRPSFTGRWVAVAPLKAEGEYTACLLIVSTGDAVVVQNVRIRRAFRQSALADPMTRAAVTDEKLVPHGSDARLPRRMHQGESLLLTNPSIQHDVGDPFVRFLLELDYTFTDDGTAGDTYAVAVDAER